MKLPDEWPAGLHEIHCRDDRCCYGCNCPHHRGEPVPKPPGRWKYRLRKLRVYLPTLLVVVGVLVSVLLIGGCGDTYTVETCSGAVRIHVQGGLVLGVSVATCTETPDAYAQTVTLQYHPPGHGSWIVVAGTISYALPGPAHVATADVSAICAVGRYRLSAFATVTTATAVAKSGTAYARRSITDQRQCK